MMQAQETFVADLDDGTSVRVVKGEVLPDKHELVKRDAAGSGMLFKPLELDDDAPPVKPSRAARASS
jgi:hypothetical protein